MDDRRQLATAPAILCDRRQLPRQFATGPDDRGSMVQTIPKSPPSTPDWRVALDFSQGGFSENFLPRFFGGNSRRKIRPEGWGGQISVQIFENFSFGPWGLSNRRAMISSVRRQRLLQQFQQRFNGTSITFTVGGARSCRPALSECRQTTVPVLSAFGVNASCVAVLCVSSVPVLLSHRSKCRRSARSSSSIGRNHSQHASGAIIHASGVLLAMPHIKAHPSATLQTVAHPARTQAIKNHGRYDRGFIYAVVSASSRLFALLEPSPHQCSYRVGFKLALKYGPPGFW